jgi:hypothetical protein
MTVLFIIGVALTGKHQNCNNSGVSRNNSISNQTIMLNMAHALHGMISKIRVDYRQQRVQRYATCYPAIQNLSRSSELKVED